ncbi:MAG: nucleotidyl transferase AbiEii/AbiGii toxin family protein [Erysipelotrichaceae bacterium]|nr:nucleotidyl transferase AbiEii/AbiGii toxin family protein [Erysipelotrichaceae bacterium]
MITIREMIQQAKADGYENENAEAKICQDIVLKAISESSLNRSVTIKGGVVMRSLTGDARRATQDMDIDFVRYSISDESIKQFILKLDCLNDIHIRQIGEISELKQQEYHGKRVRIIIYDDSGDSIESKIDLGVHNHLSIEQEEYCFEIACYDEGVMLLANSKEQIFAEKLRAFLKFGPNSTRYKDVFDMYYLSDIVDVPKLLLYIKTLIFDDCGMRENNMDDVIMRVRKTFKSSRYIDRLATSKKNWLSIDISEASDKLIFFLISLNKTD